MLYLAYLKNHVIQNQDQEKQEAFADLFIL